MWIVADWRRVIGSNKLRFYIFRMMQVEECTNDSQMRYSNRDVWKMWLKPDVIGPLIELTINMNQAAYLNRLGY